MCSAPREQLALKPINPNLPKHRITTTSSGHFAYPSHLQGTDLFPQSQLVNHEIPWHRPLTSHSQHRYNLRSHQGIPMDFPEMSHFLQTRRSLRRHHEIIIDFKLPAYSTVFLNRNQAIAGLEEGDKIILHSKKLLLLMRKFNENQLPQPVIFQICNQKGHISYCGVLEFSATMDYAYLPPWMMQNMCLTDGDTIQLRLPPKPLPKITHVTLKPEDCSTFAKIPTPKATLEYALQKFTTLTIGDTIMIKNGNNRHFVNVSNLLPKDSNIVPSAACLINAQVEVEFEITQKEEESVVKVQQPTPGKVKSNGYIFYRVKKMEPDKFLKITIEAKSGDPAIYCSTQISGPKRENAMWISTSHTLTIDTDDFKFQNVGWYYISVYGYKKSSEFVLTIEELISSETKNEEIIVAKLSRGGQMTGKMTAGSPSSTKQCDNCMSWVPNQSFKMHSVRCKRNNWRCPVCQKILRNSLKNSHFHCEICPKVFDTKTAAQKHKNLIHSLFECPKCHIKMDRDRYQMHSEAECAYRLEACGFCEMMVPACNRFDHEDACGSKSIPCQYCGVEVARKKMSSHQAAHFDAPADIKSKIPYQEVEDDDALLQKALFNSLEDSTDSIQTHNSSTHAISQTCATWNCSQCTYSNQLSRMQCEICNALRKAHSNE